MFVGAHMPCPYTFFKTYDYPYGNFWIIFCSSGMLSSPRLAVDDNIHSERRSDIQM